MVFRSIRYNWMSAMAATEQRIAELRHELTMLRMALEYTTSFADRARILAQFDRAVTEYTRLVEARLHNVLASAEPLVERSVGDTSA
jgi:hypothetical protein